MTNLDLPKGVWTEAFTGVSDQVFNLMNFPDTVSNMYFAVAYGSAVPTSDDEAIVVFLDKDTPTKTIVVSNSSPVNVYIKPLYTDSRVTY